MNALLNWLTGIIQADGSPLRVRGLITLGLTAAFVHAVWTGGVPVEAWLPIATGAISIYTTARFMNGGK